MGESKKGSCGCGPVGSANRCRVDSMVSVDARGQMVLRKELRARAGIKAGDQLAVVTWEKGGKVCCISLMRVSEFDDLVREKLGPIMKSVLKVESGGGDI